jgi:hypothetical protein
MPSGKEKLRPESPGWWTGDRIVAAIQAWAQRTGQPPTSEEWRQPLSAPVNTADGLARRSSRPTTARVIRVFGSWSESIEAAGFHAAPPGQATQEATAVSADSSHRVERSSGYPPLVEMDGRERREFHEALLDADSFEDYRANGRGRSPKRSRTGRSRAGGFLMGKAHQNPCT